MGLSKTILQGKKPKKLNDTYYNNNNENMHTLMNFKAKFFNGFLFFIYLSIAETI